MTAILQSSFVLQSPSQGKIKKIPHMLISNLFNSTFLVKSEKWETMMIIGSPCFEYEFQLCSRFFNIQIVWESHLDKYFQLNFVCFVCLVHRMPSTSSWREKITARKDSIREDIENALGHKRRKSVGKVTVVKSANKREKVISEIFSSEKTYQEQLTMIIEVCIES